MVRSREAILSNPVVATLMNDVWSASNTAEWREGAAYVASDRQRRRTAYRIAMMW